MMDRERRLAALFDMDGVVLDTEGQYDLFWIEQGKRYHPGVPDFYKKIKGMTTEKILEDYFGGDMNLQQQISRELDEFESQMSYPYVPGVENFIRILLTHGVRIALVTSSNDMKMSYALKAHPEFTEYFERMITADKITKSKPDPECYLLAAKELQMETDVCCVFEDSFAGIEAGRNARMKVVGLATTNPAEKIQGMVDRVLPDFTGYTYDEFEDLISGDQAVLH
jgi:HAD hydrolase, family IA, variant 3